MELLFIYEAKQVSSYNTLTVILLTLIPISNYTLTFVSSIEICHNENCINICIIIYHYFKGLKVYAFV